MVCRCDVKNIPMANSQDISVLGWLASMDRMRACEVSGKEDPGVKGAANLHWLLGFILLFYPADASGV